MINISEIFNKCFLNGKMLLKILYYIFVKILFKILLIMFGDWNCDVELENSIVY